MNEKIFYYKTSKSINKVLIKKSLCDYKKTKIDSLTSNFIHKARRSGWQMSLFFFFTCPLPLRRFHDSFLMNIRTEVELIHRQGYTTNASAEI